MGSGVVIDSEVLVSGETETVIGGKANGLVRLLRAGLPVPPFFVLPPDTAPAEACQTYAQLGWGKVAVRSSAVGEDGAEHSFAGMYETVLGVEGEYALLAAIETCRESAQSERISAYRQAHGLKERPVAVVVQQMVEGTSSGVLFSRDPLDPEQALISAAWGLGEGVVQGNVPTDTFWVDQTGEVTSMLASKDRCIAMVDGRAQEVPVSVVQQDEPCLDPAQIQKLVELGWRLERELGAPQDIEWTVCDEQIVVLQTRPITRPIPQGRRLLWDNSNIIESYFGPTSPLTYSFAAHAYTIVYQLFCKVMGVDEATLQANSDIFPRMIGLVRGRIYYNLNAWYRVVSLLPGYRWNRTFMEQMMGVSEVASDMDVGESGSRWSDLPRLIRLSTRLAWRVWRLDRDVAEFHTHFEKTVAPYQMPGSIASMGPHELLDAYHDLERKLLWAWHVPIVNDFFVMIGFGLLKKKCEQHFPHHPELHNQLLAGEGDLDSAKPTVELIQLAADIRSIPELRDLIQRESAEHVWGQFHRWPALYQRLQQWIVDWGDRSADELKLEQYTLRQRPHQTIPLLKGFLSGEAVEPSNFGAAEQAMRVEAEKVVRQGLGPWKRWRMGRTLRFARKRVRDRENLRFLRTRIFARVRELFIRLGEHMAAAEAILEPSDVFWLTQQEAWGWVRGTTIAPEFRELVALRKRQYAKFESEMAPADRFYTWGPVWRKNTFQGRPGRPVDVPEGVDLAGLSAFPGVVEARVRVVEDPRDEPPLNGDILVTYRTDPGWVPLFPQASGLLVERGSLLSHSAVVARELGIPTIVGIQGLMDTLKSGDRVRMDASAGTVVRLPESEA